MIGSRARVVLCTLVLAAVQSLCAAADIGTKQEQLESLRGRIQDLRQSLDQDREERRHQGRELREAESRIGALIHGLRQLQGMLETQRERLVELRAEREEQQRKLQLLRRRLAAQLRAAYAMGRQERLKLLLNQQDPDALSRMLVYYRYLSRQRIAEIEATRAGLAELRRIEHEIGMEQERLAELEGGQREEVRRLEQVREQRQTLIAQMEQRIRDQGVRLDTLRQDAQALQALLSRLRERPSLLADAPLQAPLQSVRGQLPWPVHGRLAARFGTPRGAADLRWDGVLISAPAGTEVKAVHHGRVAFADWLRGYGLLLILDHGDGYMTLYGYNQTLLKETGEWVDAGESVALVGSSGGRTRSGLYFGIRHRGRPANPRKWCVKPTGRRVGGVPPRPAATRPFSRWQARSSCRRWRADPSGHFSKWNS